MKKQLKEYIDSLDPSITDYRTIVRYVEERWGEEAVPILVELLADERKRYFRKAERASLLMQVSQDLEEAQTIEQKLRSIAGGLSGLRTGKQGAEDVHAFDGFAIYSKDEDGNILTRLQWGTVHDNPAEIFVEKRWGEIVKKGSPPYLAVSFMRGAGALVCYGSVEMLERDLDFLIAYGRMAGREVSRFWKYDSSLRGRDHEKQLLEDLGIIGILCHELMRPLTPLMGFSQVIYDESIRIIDLLNYDEARKLITYYHNKVLGRVEAMTKTVNTLLHFARIEAGKYKPKYEEYKLNKQILSLIHEIMEETTEENKQFSTYLSNDTAVVYGDPYLLTVSVENILQNALRHGEEGEIEVKTFLENGRAGITVENRGRIENIEEVFHTYKTTHEYRGGTGLGMSIVKRFIEVQNGSIDVENISDSGENLVRVTLTLPLPSGT